jgi:hypothetical protein
MWNPLWTLSLIVSIPRPLLFISMWLLLMISCHLRMSHDPGTYRHTRTEELILRMVSLIQFCFQESLTLDHASAAWPNRSRVDVLYR